MKSVKISGIILAAGNGIRFGGKKQFIKFHGKPIWKHSYDTAKAVLDEVVVVGVDFPGGKTRQKSVRIGLERVTGDKVVIFDAVRPLVTREQIELIVMKVIQYPSMTFYTKPTDTIYRGYTYEREDLKALQVPQAFDTELLKSAHAKTTLENATDDTSIMLNVHDILPHLIEGGRNLYKLTYAEDIFILNALYENSYNRRTK
jgi:2-C-methyl-D-erythritol 4-phosphate cytidylyltransferase